MRLEITANSSREGNAGYIESCVGEILQLLNDRGFKVQSCATSAGNLHTHMTTNPVNETIIDAEYEDIKEEE